MAEGQSDEDFKYQLFKKVTTEMRDTSKMTFPFEFEYLGYKFTCLEGVYPGGSEEIFQQYIHELPLQQKEKGNAVLEIGCGTGCVISALFLERKSDISRVVATDISPEAIENTKLTFERYKIPGETFLSDVYDGLNKEDKFDLIFWNFPYSWLPSNNDLEGVGKLFGDFQYKAIGRFMNEAQGHLTANGKAALVFSSTIGDKEALVEVAKQHGKKLKLLWKAEGKGFFSVEKTVELYEIVML